MPINYSLSQKKTQLGKEKSEGKFYATAQHSGILSLKEYTKRLCKRYRTLDPVQVLSVIAAVSDYLRVELLAGYRVQVDHLGVFSVAQKCEGAASCRDYGRTHIKDVYVN